LSDKNFRKKCGYGTETGILCNCVDIDKIIKYSSVSTLFVV